MKELREHDLKPDPIEQFHDWYEQAVRENAPQPDAMMLATSTKDGSPSARVVLLKSVDHRGFVFVTNYSSRKGKEIESNPVGSLVFHWPTLERQVRIEGTITRTSAEESDRLFAARARDNQLSSAASPQSEAITLEELDRKYNDLDRTYAGSTVPRPAHWGGYRLKPLRMEFWQHRFARMNDRILYVWNDGKKAWDRVRLAP
jgi:pyridoxamine 5'-phosphate oxidase